MNIRDLKLFKHLAATLHYGRTSRACNISPSGLTRTIQRLEDELGKRLFDRNQRSVSLTRAGTLFSAYADDVLQRWNSLQMDLGSGASLRGELSLYCSVTAILSILPALLERFSKDFADIHINLQTGDAAVAIDKLKGAEADICIAALPDELPRGLKFKKIIETPLLFIAASGFSQASVDEDGDIDWQKTPLILAERGLSRTRAEAWFRQERLTPNIYSQVAGNEAIITLVSMGFGIGIIPELVLANSPLKTSVRTLTAAPELKPFSVGVCTLEKNMHNPVVEAFWQTADTIHTGEVQ